MLDKNTAEVKEDVKEERKEDDKMMLEITDENIKTNGVHWRRKAVSQLVSGK